MLKSPTEMREHCKKLVRHPEGLEKYPKLSYERAKDCLAFSTFVDVHRRHMFFEAPKAACTTMKVVLHRMACSPLLTYYLGEIQSRRDMFIQCRRNVPLPSPGGS